ncbi:MAG TPA: hypothetical protein VK358_02800, partial [Longimicrobium sp.]|nr:hypothetical protein [Longimicrobium sp.]
MRVDFDMTTGDARTEVVAAWGAPASDTPTGLANIQNVSSLFVQTARATCADCNDGVLGLHTITVPLKAVGIATDLSVGSPITCTGCTATAAPIGNEAVPGDAFDVTLTVDVTNSRFSVSFSIIGTPVQLTLCVQELGFGDDHLISLDGFGNVADPVWQSSACGAPTTEIEPAAYTSGTRVKISAATIRATLEPQITKSVALDISAFGFIGGFVMKFTFARVSVPGAGGTVAIGSATADQATAADRAVVAHPYMIDWTYSFITSAAGYRTFFVTTSHPVYFTYRAPRQSSLYLTVLDLSTRKAAGMQSETAVVASVWNEFSDREVHKRVLDSTTGTVSDGALLSYYKNASAGNCTTVKGLLAYPYDAQCDAWATFLMAMFAAQGVASELIWVGPAPNSGIGLFLVDDWNFPAPPVSGPCSTTSWNYHLEDDLTHNAAPS